MSNGRPSKYDEKYCAEIVEFFDRPLFEYESQMILKKGVPTEIKVRVPCRFPTFERFAFEIGVHRETLLNWCDKHPSFFDAYKKAKDLQKEILIQNTLSGLYEKTFAIFTAKNVTDMHDTYKQEYSGEVKMNMVDIDRDDEGL